MSTYEVNIGGEVDPRLKKGIKDVAKEAKGLSKATDEVKESVHEMSSESKASVRDLARISSALADLRAATRGLTRAQQDKQRITAAAMRLHAQSTRVLNQHAQAVNRTSNFYVNARKNAAKLGVELRRIGHAGRTTAFVAAPFQGVGGGGGARRAAGAMAEVSRESGKLNQSVGRLKSSWASIITAFNTSYFVLKDVTRAFFDLTDGVIRFQNQIRQSTTNTHDFNKVMSRLRKVSRETGVSARNVGLTFQRLRVGLEGLALSPDKLLGWTEALTRGAAAFGLGTSEAGGAIRQLTQGLASGTLRGHELYSVLEQYPPLAQEIAAQLGVFTSDLRKLGAQGKITTEVLMASLDRYQKRADKAIKLVQLSPKQLATVGAEGFADLFTKFMEDSGALSVVVGTMKTINDYMANIVERARAGEPVFQRWAETIKGIGRVIYDVTLAVGSFLAGAALVRAFNMVTRIIRDLKALGAINIFANITKAITGLTGRGGLVGLGIAGLAGAGIFTLVDDFVNQFLKKINDTIEPAMREFKALMKERDSILGQTQSLTEMLWALRRKSPEEYGRQELAHIRKMIQDINALREEMERKAIGQSPWQVLGMTGGLAAPWAAQLTELQEAEERAKENIKKINMEAQKLPTQIRNFFKMIKEGAFETNREINKIAANFEKKIVTGRIQTGKTGLFQSYLEALRQTQREHPAEKASKRDIERAKQHRETLNYLLEGRVIGRKLQMPTYSGHPQHAPPPTYRVIKSKGQPFLPDMGDLQKRENELAESQKRRARDVKFTLALRHKEDALTRAQKVKVFGPREQVKIDERKFIPGLREIQRARQKYNLTLFNAALAERELAEIQKRRLDKGVFNLEVNEEKRLKKIIALKDEMLKYDKMINDSDTERVKLLRELSRSSHLYKASAPVSLKATHALVSQSSKSYIRDDGQLAIQAADLAPLQRAAMEAQIARNARLWAGLKIATDKPFAEAQVLDRATGRAIPENQAIRAKESMMVTQNQQKQITAADKLTESVQKANDQAIAFTNTVGSSLLNAFREVAGAADLFGDKWGRVFDTIIDQVGRLIIEYVALAAAQSATDAAFTEGKGALDKGYDKTLTSPARAIADEAGSAAIGSAAGGPKAALIAAGVSIGSSILSALLQKDRETSRERKEHDDSLARERFRSALVAYVQRQRMIQLQLRTAVAVENAERQLREAQAMAAREKSLREAAEIQAYRSFADARGGRADDRFGEIQTRFAADTADVETRREARAAASTPPAAAPAAAAPAQPINLVVVDSEEAAAEYARSDKGRSLILNALGSHGPEVREVLASTG